MANHDSHDDETSIRVLDILTANAGRAEMDEEPSPLEQRWARELFLTSQARIAEMLQTTAPEPAPLAPTAREWPTAIARAREDLLQILRGRVSMRARAELESLSDCDLQRLALCLGVPKDHE